MNGNTIAIYGGVPELVKKQSAEIISQFLKSDRGDFNFVKYNLYEAEIAPVIEETLALPFFSDKKAILVKSAYIFAGEKAPKDMAHNVDQLIEFIEKYDGEDLIVFEIYQNKLDEGKELTKTLKKHARLKKIGRMPEKEIRKWTRSELNENFRDIKRDALDLSIGLAGINSNIVSQEIRKSILFLGDRPAINKQDVNQIINRSLGQNVFLLTEYIQKREEEQAIHLVKDLITTKEEPTKLLALTTSSYRLFYQCKILSQKGYNGQQAAKTIGVHPYRIKLALEQIRHYQLDELLNIINACAETDYKLKSSYMDRQLILELFILSL